MVNNFMNKNYNQADIFHILKLHPLPQANIALLFRLRFVFLKHI